MAMNKKGIFFTMISVALVTVIIFSYMIYNEYRLRDKALVIETRIDTLNDFLKDLEKDIERGLYIASFRSFLTMNEYIVSDDGGYITNFNNTFNQLVLNGTIYGNTSVLINDSYFNLWVQRIQQHSQKLGIRVDVKNAYVATDMISPWDVAVQISTSIELEDMSSLAKWTRNKSFYTIIDIEGFEDPIFARETCGFYTRTIRKSPFSTFVVGTNTSDLVSHISGSYYLASNSSPSFLMRLQGDLKANRWGIESLVDVASIKNQTISCSNSVERNKTIVDYYYWDTTTPTHWRINFTDPWVRLDNASGHLITYGVSNLTFGMNT